MRPDSFAAIHLPNQSARIMASVISDAGLAVTKLLSEAGIPCDVLNEPNGVLSGAQELRLQEVFVQATRHMPGAWFRMGLRYRLMTYGPLGLAVLTAGTFGAGLRLLMSFTALTYSLMQYELIEENGEVVALAAEDMHVPQGYREFSQERALGAVTQILNDMHPSLSPLSRIETVLDASNGRHECEAVLGVPMVFEAPVTRWILKPGVAGASLPMASPLLEESYGKLCARLVDEARVSDEIVSRVYALLVRSPPHFPSATQASRMLGLSERTLYRKLASHALTFHRMVEQVREQRATDLLQNSRLSIEAVADALGFAETASFSRAFKRWRGMSPLQFRLRSATRPPQGNR
ncbi:putative HTH-type transcriptional regulator [Methylobacterium crusticola]|uniref:HTH-type transcriptional regulator n=1 Tax=Methylobacterium crusticola TaxID=1697972 RepID=A0ABQ4R2P1_9HYPH|nr:AraC family transcriptional regulator [Methylobacterium crusticola]GJD51719.1 putative HTH-type transcriptional regulator [Methylobacterium crusticola]